MESPQIRMPVCSPSDVGPLTSSYLVPSHCVLTWWKELEISLDLFYKDTNHILEGFTLSTSQKPCLLIPSYWALGLQHMNWASPGWGDPNIQTIALGLPS